ncbi:MAG TPA: hypothetical protein VMZ27_00440 [Candidatus Saccharimonadales bacterium]|nr:hypothetical protein [Candidatus Saccharimonadales bacterium]
MKVLVQNTETGFFLSEEDRWVQEAAIAVDFKSSMDALEHCLQKHLKGVQILLASQNSPQYDCQVSVLQ